MQHNVRSINSVPSSAVVPLLVSVKEAARLLGLESQSVRRLARKGEIKYKKLSPTKWLISYKSVEAYASKLVAA
jgi:excisionase family DNA binding protein